MANFNSNRDTFHLPVVKLPSWVVIFPIVKMNSYFGLFQSGVYLFTFGNNSGIILAGLFNRNDDNLLIGNFWWNDESLIIRVDHDHGSDGSGTQTPRCLPAELFLLVGVQKFYIEHFSEILAKLMGSGTLDASTTDWYVNFCRHGEISSWECLINRFSAFENWNGHKVFIA